MLRPRGRQLSTGLQDWSNRGSFMNKPTRGWLHPDSQLNPDAGVIYGVRYVGSMLVKESMKTLDFDTRTAVAKESISIVSEAAGLKNASPKKSKKPSRISKLLGNEPNLLFAGSNVNLTITTDGLTLTVMESGENVAFHSMPSISFASGGDADTMDFVAYVAKDEAFGRACHVLECGGGLAQDVITTIGQAFELRFKQYLMHKPEAVSIQSRHSGGFHPEANSWGEENDYYNDRPGAKPPDPGGLAYSYDSPGSTPVEKKDPNQNFDLIGIDGSPTYLLKRDSHFLPTEIGAEGGAALPPAYDASEAGAVGGRSPVDAFDMKPFTTQLPGGPAPISSHYPYEEKWFHGKISRHMCEDLLRRDGDFLVRESQNSPGQFVLSGRHGGRIRHLLLVDPEGVVRTKDRTFRSVSHLINYHLTNQMPIVSNESEVKLITPVIHD